MKLEFKLTHIHKGRLIPDWIGGYWVPRDGGYTCAFKIHEYTKFTKKIG